MASLLWVGAALIGAGAGHISTEKNSSWDVTRSSSEKQYQQMVKSELKQRYEDCYRQAIASGKSGMDEDAYREGAVCVTPDGRSLYRP